MDWEPVTSLWGLSVPCFWMWTWSLRHDEPWEISQHLFEMEEQRFIEEGFLITAFAWVFVIDTHLEPLVYIQITRWIHSHSSVQSLSHVPFFATPWTAACQASLSITSCPNFPVWSLLKLMSTELVMLSNHLIIYATLVFLPSIFPSISLFQWVRSSHQVAKVLEFHLQHQSFQWLFSVDVL